jgi:hypothetical protein
MPLRDGTTSAAAPNKSLHSACRYRHRRGLSQHPFKKIRLRVHLELPMRRLLLAGIEATNPRQVIGEIRPESGA